MTSTQFNGLGLHLGNLSRLSSAETRSINAENPSGAKGGGGMATEGVEAARELGQGWKVRPAIPLPAQSTTTIAEIEGPGAIQHIWITCAESAWRQLILRAYWDGEDSPSIEVPLGDFFCAGWGRHTQVSSVPVAVNPSGGFNCYWEMPFRQSAKLTIENLAPEVRWPFFYQISYALTEVENDRAYLHAQWRRSDPVRAGEVHTLLDGVRGQGHYVGTYLAWESHHAGWWGEGEIKFYLDGDDEFPTICGTGTEDYFGGAWAFTVGGRYAEYSTPYLGMPQVLEPDGHMASQPRFGLYRWHVQDPIRFRDDLRVTIQALGFKQELAGQAQRYLQLRDDIASTAFWYQTEPHVPFPAAPALDELDPT
jgi:hypothetical protein